MGVSPDKLLRLTESLLRATADGRVEWSGTYPDAPPEQDTYSLSLTRGTVSIRNRDGDAIHPFVLTIRGEQGQIVDEYQTRGDSFADQQIQDLFIQIASRVRNSDDVIDSLISDLENPF